MLKKVLFVLSLVTVLCLLAACGENTLYAVRRVENTADRIGESVDVLEEQVERKAESLFAQQKPPVAEPPATEAPVAEPPVTDTPATESPVTDAPPQKEREQTPSTSATPTEGKSSKESSKTDASYSNGEKNLLTQEEALTLVLAHTGFSRDQVKGLHSEFDYDDRVPEYEVEFYKDGWEYEYEIHAETGSILSYNKDR